MKPPAMPQTETMAVGKDHPAGMKVAVAAEAVARPQVMIEANARGVPEAVGEQGAREDSRVPVQAMAEVAELVTDDDRTASPRRC